MPIPAAKATGRFTMAPTSAANKARRSSSGLSTCVSAVVWPGDASMAVIAESTPAIVQAMVEVRPAHTPAVRADSAFSDIARIHRPHDEYRTISANPTATSGATTSVGKAPGEKT